MNDNSLSSLERGRPNKGLTLNNLSVKSMNKNNKNSINSNNNSIKKSGKKTKEFNFNNNNTNSKKSNIINLNKQKFNNNNDKQSPNQQKKVNQPQKNKSIANNKIVNSNIIDNMINNINNNNNGNNVSRASTNNQNKEHDESSFLYNYFYYNDVTLDNDIYLNALNEVLASLDSEFSDLNLNEKISRLLELANDVLKKIRLGSLVCLYLILKKNFHTLDDNEKTVILNEIIILLKSYESQEELFLLSCLEICTLFGPHEILVENFLEKFLTPICFAYLKTHSMGWDSRYRDPGGHISCLVTKKGDIKLPPFYSLISAVIASYIFWPFTFIFAQVRV
jgi:hypothetical protein